ncbi:MAG: NAD(P)-dependent glycerol-3-phosphate dehydrogenase [Burkholderiales bacterium]|nr:MAG: NAD(P)-dependent glycerol-3-phosphate dehydrogenase [Burkholderiales bacterium]TAG82635.1 MAG: NAD(P)-dependent glycerol-3-phosphate dehydrogenase [Betaproteobacteria bacterium]
MKVAVLGSGAWGTAFASRLAVNPAHEVTLWGRDVVALAAMAEQRVNAHYLPGVRLSERLQFDGSLASASASASLIILGAPVSATEGLLAQLHERSRAPVLSLAKGFVAQGDEVALLPQVLERFGRERNVATGVISGPSFASETARGLPLALVCAMNDEALSHELVHSLRDEAMRMYASADVFGVSLCGAIKNVFAIAAGVCDGLALGANARAALVTRGLAELMRLVVACGGQPETVMGLAGVGDVLLTTTGDASRNRKVGLALASGKSLADVLTELGHVAEGVYAARLAARLAESKQVELPITRAVAALLDGDVTPQDAIRALLTRKPRSEF